MLFFSEYFFLLFRQLYCINSAGILNNFTNALNLPLSKLSIFNLQNNINFLFITSKILPKLTNTIILLLIKPHKLHILVLHHIYYVIIMQYSHAFCLLTLNKMGNHCRVLSSVVKLSEALCHKMLTSVDWVYLSMRIPCFLASRWNCLADGKHQQ